MQQLLLLLFTEKLWWQIEMKNTNKYLETVDAQIQKKGNVLLQNRI